MNTYRLFFIVLSVTSAVHTFFDVKKINQSTTYNCQTGDIIVNIKGDENVAVIQSTCVFIAGATPGERRIDTTQFSKLSLSSTQKIPFSQLLRGIEYTATEGNQRGITRQLIATIDPTSNLQAKMRFEYEKRGINSALQLWSRTKFSSPLLSKQSSIHPFTLLETVPAGTPSAADMVTIFPNGDVALENAEATITIPMGQAR